MSHRRLRAPQGVTAGGEPAHLADERAAQTGVLKFPAVENVAWPGPDIDIGVPGRYVSLDLASTVIGAPRDRTSLLGQS
jgi:hypothetical protein